MQAFRARFNGHHDQLVVSCGAHHHAELFVLSDLMCSNHTVNPIHVLNKAT